jgi:cytoskeletal protein CcmA (bactofilin family)
MSELFNIPVQDHTFIGIGTHLQGTFVFKGDTKIAGKIQGEVNIEGDSPLTIEPNGKISGTLNCHNLEVYGELDGDIKATGRVTLYPSSSFVGNLVSGNLIIHPGSIVNMQGSTGEESPSFV